MGFTAAVLPKIGLLLLLCASLSAQTVTPQQLQPIKQTPVAEVAPSIHQRADPYFQRSDFLAHAGSVTIQASGEATHQRRGKEDWYVASGRDKLGHPWQVFFTAADGGVFGPEVWTLDLDETHLFQDLLISQWYDGNGHCIDESRTDIIAFDQAGRPVPWELSAFFAIGFSQGKPPGVSELGKWDKSGQPELIDVECSPGSSFPTVEQSGYYVNSVYQLRNRRWRRLSAAEQSSSETIYQEIAARNQHQAPLIPAPKGFEPDYSSDASNRAPETILRYVPRHLPFGDPRCGAMPHIPLGPLPLPNPAEEREQCQDHLFTADGTECYGSPAVVLYDIGSTEAVMDGKTDRAKELLKRIVDEHIPVTLTGQLQEGLCSPAMIWATKPPLAH